MMSWTAFLYGGGVPAGGVVAGLQSVGAAGMGYKSSFAVGAANTIVCGFLEPEDDDDDDCEE